MGKKEISFIENFDADGNSASNSHTFTTRFSFNT